MLNTLLHVELAIACGAGLIYLTLRREWLLDLGYRAVLIAAVLPAAALLSPSLVLLHLIMFFAVPLFASTRGHIPAVYLFSLMMLPGLEQPLYIGGISLFTWGINHTLAAGALLALATKKGKGQFVRRIDAPVLLVMLVFIYAYAQGEAATHWLRVVISVINDFGIPYYIISRGLSNRQDVVRLIAALALAGVFLAAILLLEQALTWPMYRLIPERFGIDLSSGLSVKIRGGLLRASGPFLESTSAAFVLTFCAVSAWQAGWLYKGVVHQSVFALFLVVGLFPPQSRGAWLGLIVSMIVVRVHQRKYLRLALEGTTALASLLALSMVKGKGAAEVIGFSEEAQGTTDYRERLFERGLEEVAKYPLSGRPFEQVVASLSDLQQGEQIVDLVNTYLQIALLTGVPGLLIFSGSLVAGSILCWTRARSKDAAVSVIAAGTTAPLFMIAFTSLGGRPATLVIAFLAVACMYRVFKIEVPARPVLKQGAAKQGLTVLPSS